MVSCFIFKAGNTEPYNEQRIRGAIVKVYSVRNKPDYQKPWETVIKRSTGSGFIIADNKILTNAHVVADQTFVEVRRHGQAKRYRAQVVSVAHEVDLAILSVKNNAFFSGVTPLEFADLPEIRQEVAVYGFPTGGNALSTTRGIVSRIEHQFYTHSSEYFLAAQIDAAINSGNSGGPVLDGNGQIVGVAMQARKSADNIGYMVPVPVIRHFLQDLEDKTFNGFPGLGLVYQKMENPGMKRSYGISENLTGILVRHILSESPAEGFIRAGDVIHAIDGHAIADDGTVVFRQGDRTNFNYYIDIHQVGETVSIEFFRNSKLKTVMLTLNKQKKDFRLVPLEQYNELPRYFIFGGIVFSPLTKNLIKSWGINWSKTAPKELLIELSNWPSREKIEIVVATRVLGSEVNRGYHGIAGWIVKEVNGKKFKDFSEFCQLVTTSNSPFVAFKGARNFQIVIDKKEAEESLDEILKNYRIGAAYSEDLKILSAVGEPNS
ncbi:S1C family serine protease [Acaryochloris marina]|nr:serine protease [Acaryochloris marina]ABW31588.1 trypsin-like serine protease, putative [Acaryochloris marina MBIC11017]